MMKTKLLLKILYMDSTPESIKSEIIETVFPEIFPYKGKGFISVSDVDKAEKILKDHVGEHEFDYYHIEKNHMEERISALITPKDKGSDYFYYGKFEIENLSDYFKKLYDNGIIIYDYSLQDAS